MPGGVPVATVACGSAGPVNAALLAVQILGTADENLRKAFHQHKAEMREKVAAMNANINS
jgi:5-(carboxyamino)imidazole ribonucleotide mutase